MDRRVREGTSTSSDKIIPVITPCRELELGHSIFKCIPTRGEGREQ